VDHFLNKEVIVTEKLDGENTSLYLDHIHARSMESNPHPSRTWVKQLHGCIRHEIPEGYRICGENLFAKHSIHYRNLPTYFFVIGVYGPDNICLSWDDTKEWCELLGLHTVPELYRGPWDENVIKGLWKGISTYGGEGEGYVVRTAAAFHYDQFWHSVAKYVRASHVQTSQHWMTEKIVPNLLADSALQHD
jgi:hypothetical protein